MRADQDKTRRATMQANPELMVTDNCDWKTSFLKCFTSRKVATAWPDFSHSLSSEENRFSGELERDTLGCACKLRC